MRLRSRIEEEGEGIILDGGEIPEVALYDSINQLALEGIQPTAREMEYLQSAVLRRYQAMIRRDLTPENRNESFFRGPERARVNWQRLHRFAEHAGHAEGVFREDAASLLEGYLRREIRAVDSGRKYNTLGLPLVELEDFMMDLDIRPHFGSGDLERLYRVKTLDFESVIQVSRSERDI